MDENELIDVRKRLAEKMAGEITISDNPGETLKKWRKNFEIAQIDLSNFLNVTPSVISDYENGRRKSPGTLIINKIINALLTIDLQSGGNKIRIYQNILDRGFDINVVYDIHEYSIPLKLDDFAKMIDAEKITGNFAKMINGHTIIDSLRAIVELSSNEFFRLYGWSTERALIFTRVSTGRSPLVAIRVTNFKPGAVVFHGLNVSKVDPIAKKIAEIEQVPLMTTNLPINELIKALRS
ncbi:MAG: helix-turn-helix domain-containing protein [Methanosarcinales archaeon Met12]|nr:MAG: helix-turn-helix domain-containing protein [Methanosarcinales archaeon Met12]